MTTNTNDNRGENLPYKRKPSEVVLTMYRTVGTGYSYGEFILVKEDKAGNRDDYGCLNLGFLSEIIVDQGDIHDHDMVEAIDDMSLPFPEVTLDFGEDIGRYKYALIGDMPSKPVPLMTVNLDEDHKLKAVKCINPADYKPL